MPLGYAVYISPMVTGFAERGIFTNSGFTSMHSWARNKWQSWKQTSRELNPLNLIRAEQQIALNVLSGLQSNTKPATRVPSSNSNESHRANDHYHNHLNEISNQVLL